MAYIYNPFTGKLQEVGLESKPPDGSRKVVNLYVTAAGKLKIEFEV